MQNMTEKKQTAFESQVPARLDRLPWSRFHWLVVFALGITWILDGLEVTFIGTTSGVLSDSRTLGLTPPEIGLIASAYVFGAVLGALYFGHLTDRHGRKKMFFVTLGVYLVGVLLSAFAWNVWSFCFFRFLTGAGIGGEYSAINSAIDELIPARVRGRVDLIINGTYWIGAALGSLSTIVLLNPAIFPVNIGWRVGFGAGAAIGLLILLLREFVPESPRWLMIHGFEEKAEAIVSEIERKIEAETGKKLPPAVGTIKVNPRGTITFSEIANTMMKRYPKRSLLGFALMVSQAFMYNAIFFTYALVLTTFYNVPVQKTGLFMLPFALGNFLGPLVLGHWFDSIGRRKMIMTTYTLSAVLLAMTGYLFDQGVLTADTQTLLWSIIFFFASAAASSAYLTVSEIFPLETRGVAIAFFYAIGTAIGGMVSPWLFGVLIGTGSRTNIFYGYIFSAFLMIAAAVIAAVYGVDAERKSLEEIAAPISMLE